jgi:nucleoside triphosphate diphosphatase
MPTAEAELRRLLDIMAALRDPVSGCPWDQQQDFASIAPYTIEEAYEVADAIARRDSAALADELGDLLFQVVYNARMAEEAGQFGFADVAKAIADKMIRRHPHVFGEAATRDAATQTVAWEQQKTAERAARAETGTLAGVPIGLPALTRAAKLTARAARVGFDWPDAEAVLAKLDEEIAEVRAELKSAICCSCWPTSPGSSTWTPRRACARPMTSSQGASMGLSKPLLPKEGPWLICRLGTWSKSGRK